MDSNIWLSKARHSFNEINNRRCHSSSPECYPRISSRSNDFNYVGRTSASMSRKRDFEDDDTFHARKSTQYFQKHELCSSPRTSHMDTSYKSIDVYHLIKSFDVNNTTICAKRIKCSETKHEKSVNLENHRSLSKDIKQEIHAFEKHSKEKAHCIKLSMKNSKNISCHSNNRLQKLEQDLKLFIADKSVKNNKNLRFSQKSKTTERNSSENELVTKSKKSCNDISVISDDTLILCIDQEEADEVLFGDIRDNIKQKMSLWKKAF